MVSLRLTFAPVLILHQKLCVQVVFSFTGECAYISYAHVLQRLYWKDKLFHSRSTWVQQFSVCKCIKAKSVFFSFWEVLNGVGRWNRKNERHPHRRSFGFCGVYIKKKTKRQTLSFAFVCVCGWNDVTDHWLFLVAFCCLSCLTTLPK